MTKENDLHCSHFRSQSDIDSAPEASAPPAGGDPSEDAFLSQLPDEASERQSVPAEGGAKQQRDESPAQMPERARQPRRRRRRPRPQAAEVTYTLEERSSTSRIQQGEYTIIRSEVVIISDLWVQSPGAPKAPEAPPEPRPAPGAERQPSDQGDPELP